MRAKPEVVDDTLLRFGSLGHSFLHLHLRLLNLVLVSALGLLESQHRLEQF